MPDSYHRTKRRLHAFVIAPRSVASGTEVHLAGGVYPNHANHDELDKLRDIARDLLTQVYRIEGTNRATITEILRATLAGEDVYNDTALEFFELYGRVQQTLGISDSDGHHVTHLKMTALIESEGDISGFRTFLRPGRKPDTKCPLPVYVRNVLSHGGTNKRNSLGREDIRDAIAMLKRWV